MRGSVDFLKALRAGQGQNLTVSSPAACMGKYDMWASRLDPNDFTPLIVIRGGMSIVGSHGRGLDALLIGNDWINQCLKAGASVKNSIICLAANYDLDPGMVACALELAMVANKDGTDETMRISRDEYLDTVLQVYGNDYASIYKLMNEKWDVQFKPGAKIPPAIKTRSIWRKESGHDVLIHPVTLEPCRARDNSVLWYDGIAPQGFEFSQHRATSGIVVEQFTTEDFPPVHKTN